MKEVKSLNSVAEFHNTFGHPVKETPSIPDKSRCDLRVSLLSEELNELKEAIENNDLIEVADALCDLQYVLSGAILEFGLGSKFEGLFNEVHRSNMSKACDTVEEAEKTMKHYEEKGQESYYGEKDGKYLVFRKEDNKTLKSINYSPAELARFID